MSKQGRYDYFHRGKYVYFIYNNRHYMEDTTQGFHASKIEITLSKYQKAWLCYK